MQGTARRPGRAHHREVKEEVLDLDQKEVIATPRVDACATHPARLSDSRYAPPLLGSRSIFNMTLHRKKSHTASAKIAFGGYHDY
jgi:hypothetical protein